MVLGTEKVPQQITEYKEYNTDTSVRFLVKMGAEKLRDAERKGLHKFFSLQNSLSCNNTLVSRTGVLKMARAKLIKRINVSKIIISRYHLLGMRCEQTWLMRQVAEYTSSLQVLFDEFGCLRKFNSTAEILREFYQIRARLYVKRKDFLLGLLTAESKRLSNQARFILEKIDGKISICKLL